MVLQQELMFSLFCIFLTRIIISFLFCSKKEENKPDTLIKIIKTSLDKDLFQTDLF